MNVLTSGKALLASIVLTMAGSASAADVGVVSHLNLVSDKHPDISTLEAWKKSFIRDGMTDQEKAIAIFETVTRYRHQSNPPREYLSGPDSDGHVHDPLKGFHVYGYDQCCCASAKVIGLARYLGMTARGRDITAHSVPEIFYNNAWHMVDGSVMNYHLKPNGDIAGVEDLHAAIRPWADAHPELMSEKEGKMLPDDKKLRAFAKNEGWKKGPELLSKSDKFYGKDGVNTAKWHGWSSTIGEYYNIRGVFEFCTIMGYQLNVQLRPGEKITRNFSTRGIEYSNKANPKYYNDIKDRKLLGLQGRMGDQSPGRVADGTVEWNVPLAQYKSVALSSENVVGSANGVSPAGPDKPGSLVLRFPSSYVYIKGRADVKATIANGGSLTILFSDNNGLDWKELARFDQTIEQPIDLTSLAFRRYDYRLKFEMTGTGTVLTGVKTNMDFQCSQAALPVIVAGENKLTLKTGPQEGTITVEGSTNPDATKQGQVKVTDFHPTLNHFSERLEMTGETGDATFDVAAPGEINRVRISTVHRATGEKDGIDIQLSTDNGKTFNTFGKLAGGVKGDSRYFITEVPAGLKAVKVRFAGRETAEAETYLQDFRIDADYKEPTGGFKPVKITYAWDENGQPKSHVHVAKSENESFSITCGEKAVVKSFSMELAE